MGILHKEKLKKTFRRLKNNTKSFSSLLIRDVFDFIDYESNLENNLNNLVFKVNNNNYKPQYSITIESPKSKGINRHTVVFELEDMLIYRYCIEEIQNDLFKKVRQKNIRGGIKIKAIKTPDGDAFYEKWFNDWLEHNEAVEKSLTNSNKYAVTTDIASYFENINQTILKELILSEIPAEKKEIVNLLFYFLEHTKVRTYYESNSFIGLPQEDIDCSRILAYFFLYPHDKEMIDLCKNNNGFEYYRYVDDMTVIVPDETCGRLCLKTLTKSLRNLGLLASIEKTSIHNSEELIRELFIEENKKLSEFEEKIKTCFQNKQPIPNNLISDLKRYYKKLSRRRIKDKNWIKILKRFYTLFTYCREPLLLKEIKNHLIYFPALAIGNKLIKYLYRTKEKRKQFNSAINEIISYLYSRENLYPALETSLLEAILYFDEIHFKQDTLEKIQKLGEDIFFLKNNYKPNSEYARALSILLIYKFNKAKIDQIAEHYINKKENNSLLKKYLVSVALTSDNENIRNKVFKKAQNEADKNLSQFLIFLETLDEHKTLIERYLKNHIDLYILYDKEKKIEIKERYNPVRHLLLSDLIKIYSKKNEKRNL